MLGEEVKHVIEKADARGILIRARAVEAQPNGDRGFAGGALNSGVACVEHMS